MTLDTLLGFTGLVLLVYVLRWLFEDSWSCVECGDVLTLDETWRAYERFLAQGRAWDYDAAYAGYIICEDCLADMARAGMSIDSQES